MREANVRTVVARLLVVASLGILAAATPSSALPNNGNIPILAYHAWAPGDHPGLESDLAAIDANGFKVIPVWWAVQWMLGNRDGSTLPDCVIALTSDDGHFSEWTDWPAEGVDSFKTILEDFKATHNQPNTHLSAFVVASPLARNWQNAADFTEDWWGPANASGIMEVYNHGADHDWKKLDDGNLDTIPDFPPGHCSLLESAFVPNTYIAVGDPSGQGGIGLADFFRIDSYMEADKQVRRAGNYIATKISPAYPDLFATPYGDQSTYLRDTYFPDCQTVNAGCPQKHNVTAAFGPAGSVYVDRNTNRWAIPRFVYGHYDIQDLLDNTNCNHPAP